MLQKCYKNVTLFIASRRSLLLRPPHRSRDWDYGGQGKF